jgi:hypothetical protein
VRAIASVIAGACLVLAGCSTPVIAPDSNLPRNFDRPERLYILDKPCRKMCVEIDAVKGCEPGDATLKKLHDFFTNHCAKPDGIDVFRGAVIPKDAARGLSPETIAARWVKGPPKTTKEDQPAFVQILFYDSDVLTGKPFPHTGHGDSLLLKSKRVPPRNPQTEAWPYPSVVFMNTRYFYKKTQDDLLLHEAGHILGLASRTNFAAAHHCSDHDCLMYKRLNVQFHISRFFLGPGAITFTHPKLCERCLAELADTARQPAPENLRFVGPVLVRTEPGYRVLTLPARADVLVGQYSDSDCADLVNAVRAGKLLGADGDANMNISDDVLNDAAKLDQVLHRLGSDPLGRVRDVALQACVARGLPKTAVEIGREALKADPEDDFIYDKIAWIEATCPDAALRNGNDAVKNATKACELTDWENLEWIDTLAAAYAEKGDFASAIQFEKQALRMTGAGSPIQRELRQRILLYEQSKPFRVNR